MPPKLIANFCQKGRGHARFGHDVKALKVALLSHVEPVKMWKLTLQRYVRLRLRWRILLKLPSAC